MPRSSIKKGTASFQTEGRLLQELGERLVARVDVALLELIKNSYDADASECRVTATGTKIEIVDDGVGMTEKEFLDKWMHIATPDRQRQRKSRKYKRVITGSKGIGRFAVRFLGRHLRLETTAEAARGGGSTLLTVNFDWERIDKASKLHTVKIAYSVRSSPRRRKTQTRLIITKLQSPQDIDLSRATRSELLALVDPYSGLERGRFASSSKTTEDPGFKLTLPGPAGEDQLELASSVLSNAYARVTVDHNNGLTKFLILHRDGRVLVRRRRTRPSHISRGFYADIRYFPRRAGMFQRTEVDGRKAWGWIRAHQGVGIVDHGFRIRTYGFEDDDWLSLSLDSAHNRRTWRVPFMNKLFPMPEGASSQAKLNPMLYLPDFHQLVGAVFVESAHKRGPTRPTDLTSSMDREGFVDNEAFREVVELVRAGLEMLAFADHKEQRRLEEARKRKETNALRRDLRAAAASIEHVPGLSAEDRDAISGQFTALSKELESVEDYYQVATYRLEMMGLLGVLAGFLTHEMGRVINGLDRLLKKLKRSFPKDKKVAALVGEIKQARSEIAGQLDYSSAFIDALHDQSLEPIDARAASNLVVNRFLDFTRERGIKVSVEIEEGVLSPPLPRALYSGVAVNLFTNALKAAVGGADASPVPIPTKAVSDSD